MQNKKHKTTREFYDKYEAMKKDLHISLLPKMAASAPEFFGRNLDELREEYLVDPNLNQIRLQRFDAIYVPRKFNGFVISLAENVCLYKHCLIYEILGLEPEFID